VVAPSWRGRPHATIAQAGVFRRDALPESGAGGGTDESEAVMKKMRAPRSTTSRQRIGKIAGEARPLWMHGNYDLRGVKSPAE